LPAILPQAKDMFMRNLKSLIYAIHSELKNKVTPLKKAHLYELATSYIGYKSYAAYKSNLSNCSTCKTDPELAKRQCFDRALALGFTTPDSFALSQCIEAHLTKQTQSQIQFEKLYQWYEKIESDDELENKDSLNAVKLMVEDGLPEGYLLAIVICSEVISEFLKTPDNSRGKYWYDKRLSGASLNILQTEVANSYSEVKDYFDILSDVFSHPDTFVIPSPIIARDVVERFSDEQRNSWTNTFNQEPDIIVDSISQLLRLDLISFSESNSLALSDWETAVLIANPISKHNLVVNVARSDSDEEKWFWHLYGLNHGIDVTVDELYAINADTGEEYDDYGPMEVAGYEGLSMPNISPEMTADMKLFALHISDKFNRPQIS
jgi:hypothetical protein